MSEKDGSEAGDEAASEPYDGRSSVGGGFGDTRASQPNGTIHSESSVADADASLNQVANMEQTDSDNEEAGPVGEDAGKDEFVDAPEELNADAREAIMTAGIEGASEERSNLPKSDFGQLENGTGAHQPTDELFRLQMVLEKTVIEKEISIRQYKEERDIYAKELGDLRRQLKGLTVKRPLLHENGDRIINHEAESDDGEEKTHVPGYSPHDMFRECSDFIKVAQKERLQMEATIGNLHAILSTKDQQMEDLKSKIADSAQKSAYIFSNHQNVDDATSRILDSLALVVEHEDLWDDSASEKINLVERRTLRLIEKFNQICLQIDHLRQCLSEVSSESLDSRMQEDRGDVIIAACNELLKCKRTEAHFAGKLSQAEDDNRKLIEQLNEDKDLAEETNAELSRLKSEIEQERMRCGNVKEKLGMAVTKGKSLVQQRDLLKHSLAEKTDELERCLIELQEKSSALEAAEQSKEELVQQRDSLKHSLAEKTDELERCLIELQEKSSALEVADQSKEELVQSEQLVALLQENLSQRNAILVRFEEILSEASFPEEMKSAEIVDKYKWLVDERNMLKGVYREFQKLKDSLTEIELSESFSTSNLESRIFWLKESFTLANNEAETLRGEISRIKEAAYDEIDRLTAACSVASVEKEYLEMEVDEITLEYNDIVKKEQQVSWEKEQMVMLLVKASGISVEEDLMVHQRLSFSDCNVLIERCFEKVTEQRTSELGPPHADLESFERIKSLLYLRVQELMLYENVLEEEMLEKSQKVDNFSYQLQLLSNELETLKEEKDHLQKDLERSEEKSALLREKLSMAVKKGKGLVQDRENLKHLLDEKNSEIEKLKLEIQQQESAVTESKDQINRMSTHIEHIPKLEADLVALKDQRDQLEQFLLESNNMLQRVIESVDGIDIPANTVFEEPVEKVKWLAGYLNDCQKAKEHTEEELAKVREESSDLLGRLAEAHTDLKLLQDERQGFEKLKVEAIDLESKLVEAKASIKALEDLLSGAQDDVLRLVEEKREIETSKENVEKELLKAIEEASFQVSNFTEACARKKSLEEALSQAENHVNALTNEKEAAHVFRAAAERELEKLKEQISIQTGKLVDAQQTIESLEDASLELEKKLGLLTEQNHNLGVERSHMETELKKLQDESATKEIKLADASVTIKSLEDAVSKAENDVLELDNQNKRHNQEVSALNSKLNACLEELAGKNGSLENRSLELVSYLNELHALVKNETLFPLMKDCFEKKWEGLKSMNDILERVKDQHICLYSEAAEKQTADEEDPIAKNQFPVELSDNLGVEMDAGLMNEVGNDISSMFRRTIEGFQLKDKILVDKFEGLSAFIDEILAALLKKLEERCDDVKAMSQDMRSLKQDLKDMETYKPDHGNTVSILEDDIATLLSACTNATTKLLLEVERNSLGQLSSAELETSSRSYAEERESSIINAEWYQKKVDGSKYAKPIRDLLFSVQSVHALIKRFQSTSEVATSKIENMENELKEAKVGFMEAIEDRNIKQNRIFELETEVETLQNSCSELRLKLKDCQADYDKLKQREAELLEVHSNSLMRQQESSFMSPSQRAALLDKVDGVRISSEELGGDTEPHISPHVKKLFYIVDSFTRVQEQISLLSHDNEELQSTLADQVLVNKHLQEEVETRMRYEEDSEKMKRDLSDLRVILEKVINMFGGRELVSDHNTSSLKGLLATLEKQIVNVLMEFENSKSEAQELELKLLGSQKLVEELSSKVKLLEDSLQGRSAQPEIIQERSIFEAPSLPAGSEISEVEDVESVGKPLMPPVPSAAHARTMRKGSTDHLALSIDLESNPLISNQETDEDKGHVFKSLNTSGLIPKQGKLVADRIDGIWVSGGRILMSRPGARLGLIAYWLFLHIWLLGTIL
ncbi:trans-Golgi network-localized SYP41-interacting protein 1 isoform X2 [Rhodamnia argentea]|uniref:Trans-Golgi network-localized SYP41-interacting protein 1 isoform X2 n=1 Tax=Rhodamnia argentea TaxID=178133 RepID=A0A8B8NYN7_9MYRT|nr:trans-Golgi network-localized SYP41-interacting protein 1 isoform X2 [Rhodamnia argentea]